MTTLLWYQFAVLITFLIAVNKNKNKPNSLREEAFILAHGSRGFLFHVGEGRADTLGLWWWEP